MKAHIFISVGLLFTAIFFIRGLEALNDPGYGLKAVTIVKDDNQIGYVGFD